MGKGREREREQDEKGKERNTKGRKRIQGWGERVCCTTIFLPYIFQSFVFQSGFPQYSSAQSPLSDLQALARHPQVNARAWIKHKLQNHGGLSTPDNEIQASSHHQTLYRSCTSGQQMPSLLQR